MVVKLFSPLSLVSAVCLPYQSVVAIYPRRFSQTRFVTKYRACDGVLVLKVTNDIACLKFKTDSSGDLRHLERLTSWFLSQSTRKHIAGASGKAATHGGAGDE